MELNLSEIQKNSEMVDRDELHNIIYQKVNSGEYDTYLEALSAYIEENDVDEKSIKHMVSPTLVGILYQEAMEKNMLVDSSSHKSIEEFF